MRVSKIRINSSSAIALYSFQDIPLELETKTIVSGISKKPIWIVIPCHRVHSHEGELTGYALGLKLEQYLLDLESKQMSLF